MAGIIDEFLKSYGQEVSKQMSGNFNVDQGTVVPGSLLGGLTRRRQSQSI